MNAPLHMATGGSGTATALAGQDTAEDNAFATRPTVIIGGGPAGIRAAQELSRRGFDTVIYNAERWAPYNRVKLTPLLCGDAQVGNIIQPLAFPGPGRVKLYSGNAIVDIDRERRTITTRHGRIQPYSNLIFATGSRAHVPPVPGAELDGVFTFRNFDDVERLVARCFRARRAIIIGGGLLGLEAARGMAGRGVDTWVIEHERHLMIRQIDDSAGAMLARHVEGMGIRVRTGCAVRSIDSHGSEPNPFRAHDRVESVTLSTGERVPCDTVIFCTGVRANKELARDIGLAVGRGIRVSDRFRTSDPNIYAVGECAEINDHVCGLVGPAYEQAVIAARDIAGDPVPYTGAIPATKLKIVGIDLFSIGDIETLLQDREVRSLTFEQDGIYRRLLTRHGRIAGAIALGPWTEIGRLQESARKGEMLLPWQRFRFLQTGEIWRDGTPADAGKWPRQATICNCTGINCGQIRDCIAQGADDIDAIRAETGASTVCGSCETDILKLLGGEARPAAKRGWRTMCGFAAVAGLLGLATLLLPAWPFASTIMGRGVPETLWLDGYWKQVSGFTLLGISAAAALLSLRKRIRWLTRLGNYGIWRILHLGVGLTGAAALIVHSGFRLGDNLNFWLMASFLGICIAGALAGLATALEHRDWFSPDGAARLRSASFWLHLVAFWPLPVLLSLHVLSVYYF